MAIRNWHVGKVILIWAWCIALVVFALELVRDEGNPLTGSLLILAILAAPIAASVVTWKWLGGKEP